MTPDLTLTFDAVAVAADDELHDFFSGLLDNTDLALRPGMKGHARIRTAHRSLWWIVFHRPWNHLASWLDW